MAALLPESTRDVFERPLLCALSPITPDGRPHTVPVWRHFDGTFDGTNVRVNCPAASRKARNMPVGSNVTLLVIDSRQPYHWIEVMRHVAEIRDEAHGARDHINSLARKYTGNPVYQGYGASNFNRLMYIVEPDVVHGR